MNIKRIIQEEVNDFDWAEGMIDPLDFSNHRRLVFFVYTDEIEWTESQLKKIGYRPNINVEEHKEWLKDADQVAVMVTKYSETEKIYTIHSRVHARYTADRYDWLDIIENPFIGNNINESDDFDWIDDIGSNPHELDWDEYHMRSYLDKGGTIDFCFPRKFGKDGPIHKNYTKVFTLSKEGKRFVVTTKSGNRGYYKINQIIDYIKSGQWELI
jgi:hypothetical protein